MKKIFLTMAVMVAAITMTSCGGNKTADGNTEVATEQAEEQAEFNGETYSKDAAKAVEEIENDPAKKAQVDKALKDAGLK